MKKNKTVLMKNIQSYVQRKGCRKYINPISLWKKKIDNYIVTFFLNYYDYFL